MCLNDRVSFVLYRLQYPYFHLNHRIIVEHLSVLNTCKMMSSTELWCECAIIEISIWARKIRLHIQIWMFFTIFNWNYEYWILHRGNINWIYTVFVKIVTKNRWRLTNTTKIGKMNTLCAIIPESRYSSIYVRRWNSHYFLRTLKKTNTRNAKIWSISNFLLINSELRTLTAIWIIQFKPIRIKFLILMKKIKTKQTNWTTHE